MLVEPASNVGKRDGGVIKKLYTSLMAGVHSSMCYNLCGQVFYPNLCGLLKSDFKMFSHLYGCAQYKRQLSFMNLIFEVKTAL